MGVGSTGVAAKNLGRKFVGIEIDKTYYDAAEKRITNCSLCNLAERNRWSIANTRATLTIDKSVLFCVYHLCGFKSETN